uniref:Angiotensin-converting enzyme n=1 Tax=Hadrurus spadix TaxID=141984 RepID=A0A1W7R9Y0_9SCOR
MTSVFVLISLICLGFQLVDVILACESWENNVCRKPREKLLEKYLMEQNWILYQACMREEPPHFKPIPLQDWRNISIPDYKKALELISKYIEYDDLMKELPEEISSKSYISNIYHNAAVCLYEEDSVNVEKECKKKWISEIYDIFEKDNNWKKREHYWASWRNATGKKIKERFQQNYKSIAKIYSGNEYWALNYNTTRDNMFQDIDKAWKELLPLYQQLHAYIRRKLIKKYEEGTIRENGPIPEHLLDILGDNWWGLKDSILPFPEEKDLATVTAEQNMTISQIIEICEKFYESIGFQNLGEEFWQHLKKIKTNGSDCQNSVFAGCDGFHASVTICHKEGNGNYFFYYLIQNLISVHFQIWNSQHRKCGWADVLNGYPNPGFESGIKGVVDISVSTRNFSTSIGITNANSYAPENIFNINHLMKMALWSFVSLQYYYNIAKWMLDLSTGAIQPQEMNTKWWEYSLKYRGVCPSVKRTELDFDPGALSEIANNLPVVREFLGRIYQFQFHKGLCKIMGTDASLQSCNIYKSNEAGNRIRKMMALGRTEPWQEAMKLMTNEENTGLDVQPLLDYYKPLYEWLVEQNKNESIGWESDDATICP